MRRLAKNDDMKLKQGQSKKTPEHGTMGCQGELEMSTEAHSCFGGANSLPDFHLKVGRGPSMMAGKHSMQLSMSACAGLLHLSLNRH